MSNLYSGKCQFTGEFIGDHLKFCYFPFAIFLPYKRTMNTFFLAPYNKKHLVLLSSKVVV